VGGLTSPLFANIYLHYVLDLWADRWRRREATGDMIIVRYADDVVAGFEHEDDARRFLDAMRTRFEEFALSLHPDKTRLIEFGRHAAARRERRGLGKPETFNFLGLTFICGKSRNGGFLLHRKSRGDRMRAKLQEIQEELRRRRHQAIPLQGEWLRRVVSGYFNYHAVPTNSRALTVFHYHIRRLWLRTLQRRSEKDGSTWKRIEKLAADWLPKPRIQDRQRRATIVALHAGPIRNALQSRHCGPRGPPEECGPPQAQADRCGGHAQALGHLLWRVEDRQAVRPGCRYAGLNLGEVPIPLFD